MKGLTGSCSTKKEGTEENKTFYYLSDIIKTIRPESCPVESKTVKASAKKVRNKVDKNESVYIKYISLTKKYLSEKKEGEHGELDRTDRIAVKTDISGYIRAQHYGSRNSMVKYIYIDDFDSVRWNTSKDKIVHVGL